MSEDFSKKLPQYRGELTANQTAAGMNAAIKNAKRLLQSANLLFENGDFPSTVSLAILAIEESGKVSILRRLVLAQDQKHLNESWKDYRTHVKKTTTWDMGKYISSFRSIRLEDFRSAFDSDNKSPHFLDQIKQIGFYTDCLGKAHWSIPSEIIDKDFAKRILTIAQCHCSSDKIISEREIELWIECLKPVWMKSMEEMKRGLILWRRKMKEENLVPEDDRFEEFISSGIDFGAKR